MTRKISSCSMAVTMAKRITRPIGMI
jgi:hypothetical protein